MVVPKATDFGLYLIELGDALQPFAGNLRAVALEDFTQLSPRVSPTIGDTERVTAHPVGRIGEIYNSLPD